MEVWVKKAEQSTREKILDVALDVLIEEGGRGTTFRKIATKAQLSPGTITYHFNDLNQLLLAAFRRMVETIASAFAERLRRAQNREEAREAVADLICGDVWASSCNMLLSFELYSLAARREGYRQVLQEWMARSRDALHLHFDMKTARALDALIEGYTIHNLHNDIPVSREEILDTITAVTR
ncbi:TetR family transcriptional regulator [Enterobacterales bacterium CwR94]|nr:TetR family transcriptional regulator [Enterobacterales bacterium CwR94]